MILLASFIVKMIEGRIRLCVSFFSCFGGVVYLSNQIFMYKIAICYYVYVPFDNVCFLIIFYDSLKFLKNNL
jgi:hypothetical protein